MFSAVFIVLISCHKEIHQPGICLSFDDRSVNEWFSLRELFLKYDVKATFFVSEFDSLSVEEIEKLHLLEKDGHEIASHGARHVDAEKFIKKYSYKEYLKTEIDASIISMQKSGFNPVSFAYPYGSKYWFTDYMLLKKFKCTRGVADLRAEKDLTQHNELFYSFNGDNEFTALDIDRVSNLSKEMMIAALDRAQQENEVLLLFAHVPSSTSQNDYSFDVDFLKSLFKESSNRNLKFYRYSDLCK